MVKILYNGAMATGNCELIGMVEKGKVYIVTSDVAKQLVLNPDFTVVEKPKDIVKKVKKDEDTKFPNINE